MIQPAFASSNLESLTAQAHQKKLAQDPYWHRLLHYSRTLLGRYQSEIDDASFFLSPRGRRDPAAELDATLAAFFASPPGEAESQPAQCRYPARLAWLKEQLPIDTSLLPAADCSRFEKWRAQMDPGSLSLVFASYYMNNPSSTYGHTFLRLNAKSHSSQERLLDYVVNFAADLESDNGFLFAVKGLMGGYHGRFSTFPYYMKVQEYSNLELRDLWEYDLKGKPAQVERLVQHLWELGNTRIPYYFFNKNCSYYLLPVLDVMDPTLSASRPFIFKAIPIDTVRQVIEAPGMLESVTYRPSHATKMLAARNRLTPVEIRLAEQLAVDPSRHTITSLPRERQALVLDSAFDLFRYRVGFKPDQPEAIQNKGKSLLLLRNAVGVQSPPLVVSSGALASPDQGHRSGLASVSYGFSNRSHFEEVTFRSALHGQDDPPAGYLPGIQLEMFNAKLRYDNDRKTLYLHEFSLVDILSITPWDRWIHPLSWKIRTGLVTASDLNRDPENSLAYDLAFGSGYAAWIPGTRNALLYGLAQLDTQAGPVFEDNVRFGGGPAGGLLWNPIRLWRARLEASYSAYAVGGPSTTKLALHQSFVLSKSMELRAVLERQNTYKEVLLSCVWFL